MAVTDADILGWLNANPGADAALINQTMAEAGVSAAQYQDATGASLPEAAPTTITELYQQVLGRPPESAAVIADWQKQFGSTIEPNEIAQFEKVAQLEKTNPAAATLKGQILGQNTTDKWTGQGYGSAEANAEAMAKLLADAGITDINQFGKLEGGGFGNKVTGEEINRGSGRWERQGGETLFSGTGEGKGNTAFRAEFAPDGTPIFYTTQGSSSDVSKGLMTALSLAAGYFAPGVGNAILGAGANQIAAGALGGGLLGGGLAAATGQDVLKGALTGGIGGAIAGYFSPSTGEITSVPTEGSIPLSGEDIAKLSSTDLGIDYSLANGTGMNPLTDMGGAQGLQAGTSANLANMGGAQGITLNLGPASTTLANALSTFGGMNPANLDAMGGAQGLTYQTPTGVVTQGKLIPTGGSTGNKNVIGETGINTAYNIGGDLGKALAAVDTGVYDSTKGMLSSAVTGTNTDGTSVTKTTSTNTGSILDNLTTGQIANIIAGVGGIVGGAAITSGGGTGGGVGALPTQGVPLNTADYFNAIQQNYNRLLPAVPRDVATPLAQWYNSQYGA